MNIQVTSQPVLRIAYSTDNDAVNVTPGDIFGIFHLDQSRIMRHKNLPALFFQLIDKGYSVARDAEDYEGMIVVFAWSREYVRRVGGW